MLYIWLVVDTRSGKRINCKRPVVNVAFTGSIPGIKFHGEHEVNQGSRSSYDDTRSLWKLGREDLYRDDIW